MIVGRISACSKTINGLLSYRTRNLTQHQRKKRLEEIFMHTQNILVIIVTDGHAIFQTAVESPTPISLQCFLVTYRKRSINVDFLNLSVEEAAAKKTRSAILIYLNSISPIFTRIIISQALKISQRIHFDNDNK